MSDKFELQNRLFSELSRMFGKEVPLYDRALAVNGATNRAVCDLLARLHRGFSISPAQLERTSGERHGAIRIGRPDEYRWVARFFGVFGMEPHNFFDMTAIGSKRQPIIATAFRSVHRPEHRVFTSLLMTGYFDDATRARIEALLSKRDVFSARAKELIERAERDGGLSAEDGDALVREGVDRIFRWTGKARDHRLYKELSDAGFKVAADIACFQSHHLNHLTPNTLLMDLYVAAMKHCMGELDEAGFRRRATRALERLAKAADRDWLRLHFKHLSHAEIDSYQLGQVSPADIAGVVDGLLATFRGEPFQLGALKHAGFKDFTEGPSEDTPVLLRQDADTALTQPVTLMEAAGSMVGATPTARVGEIEERFYACTPAGRALYDRCLAEADAARERDPSLPKRDWDAYEHAYAAPFAAFPKTLPELVERGLVFAQFAPTPAGLAAARAGRVTTTDLVELSRQGLVTCEGLRYEDFLPVSAAGIFASNLNHYGTASTARVRPTYSKAVLEAIMGKPIVEAAEVSAGIDAASRIETWTALGVIDRVPADELARLERLVSTTPAAA
ncbi:MAG: 2-oxoadipate dioxygenase/decarboxylase family protein [Phycisphaerales bacterium]